MIIIYFEIYLLEWIHVINEQTNKHNRYIKKKYDIQQNEVQNYVPDIFTFFYTIKQSQELYFKTESQQS